MTCLCSFSRLSSILKILNVKPFKTANAYGLREIIKQKDT